MLLGIDYGTSTLGITRYNPVNSQFETIPNLSTQNEVGPIYGNCLYISGVTIRIGKHAKNRR